MPVRVLDLRVREPGRFVFLGWAVLSEQVTPTIAAGALAVLLSVAFVLRTEAPCPAAVSD